MEYQAWYAAVKNAGGVPVTWPFSKGIYADYYGQPAARWDIARYVELFGSDVIDPNAVQQTTLDNSYAYVLAPEGTSAGAPHTMTAFEEAQNTAFTALDAGAGLLGLPSLSSVSNFLKATGWIGLALGLGVALVYAESHRPKK